MLAKVDIEDLMTGLGYTQPVKGKYACWVKVNCGIVVFYMPKSLLTKGGACYAIRKGDDLMEAFSIEELKAKCYEMERRCYDNA